MATEVRPRPTDALVIDANTRQALVAVRALGRSGLRVAVAEAPDMCDPRFRVPAFASRWSAGNSTLPSYYRDPTTYAQAVLDLVRERPTRVLIPLMDGSIATLRPWRSHFEHQNVALALASESALEVANDKQRTLTVAARLGILSPRTASLIDPRDISAALAEVGYPAVIKPTQSWVCRGESSGRVVSKEVLDEPEALAYVQRMHELGSSTIAQQWVGGSREAVSLFYAGGRVWAEFAQIAHRMTPVLGGVSVVRESIPMPADLRSAAVGLVEALDLEGYCEVEFRRDSSGRPLLMEINARLSGSVEVAVRSGVDFPSLLWRWAVGEPLTPVPGYRNGVRMRYLNGDVEWLWENLKRRGRPDSVPPWRALTTFASEFLRGQGYDYVDRRDLRPAWVALLGGTGDARRRFAKGLASNVSPATADLETIGV
jgi:glutathione synthase/RimK-type ligase-like ATP-grasp enzyme